MGYRIDVIRKEDQKTTNWSGGITTQLAIFPPEASYKECNFKWRISCASVEVEKSTFTTLPGIDRYIMVLQGESILEHKGYHTAYLKPFEVDHFSGEWMTESVGKIKDFNLMLGKESKGEIKAITIENRTSFEMVFGATKNQYRTEAFYCAIGNVDMDVNQLETVSLKEGDLLLLHIEKEGLEYKIKINNEENQCKKVVKASIQYDKE